MAAYSGNSTWIARYQLLEREWNQRMSDLVSSGKNNPLMTPLAQETKTTGDVLFSIEHEAFGQLLSHQPQKAQAILMSSQYESAKTSLRTSLSKIIHLLDQQVALAHKRSRLLLIFSLVSILLLMPLTFLTFYALRAIRQLEKLELQMMQASKMAALGEMASGIAHEVNNPLTAIIGRAGLLIHGSETDRNLPRAIGEHAKAIRSTALRIAAIIRSLRMFAREDEKDPLETVPVRNIINETLDLCRERFRVHGIDLKTPLPRPELLIDCHPVQISQAILNLLNNAYDALEHASAKWVSLDVIEDPTLIYIQVTDSGPGIPEELRDKILQPFFTTKPRGKGTGLGLSISQRIVEASEGSLYLDRNSPNTRFVICFPKSKAQPRTTRPTAA
jgi:C4-dicarboxylate-specific signal transduction histidine kinase